MTDTPLIAVTAPHLLAETRKRLQRDRPGWSAKGRVAERSSGVGGGYEKNATVVPGSATETAVRAGLSSIARAAAHGARSDQRREPLFHNPRFRKSNFTHGEEDGTLETREIMNLNIPARVAILSDGAAMSMRNGASAADVVQWGWLAGGVPSLLLARWPGDGAASDVLLAEFHRGLVNGSDPAAALHAARARRRRRRNGPPRTSGGGGWYWEGSRLLPRVGVGKEIADAVAEFQRVLAAPMPGTSR